jgi:hypothetical protein
MILLLEFQSAQIESKRNKTFITGKFLAGNVLNKNGRMYPVDTLNEAVEARRSDIKNGGMFGMLGHPSDGKLDPARISHVVTNLDRKGNNWYGRARLIDEGVGKIARSIIDCGGLLGVSSRGTGNLKKQGEGNIVEGFALHGIDLVTDPSTPGAAVKKISESFKRMPLHEQVMALDTLGPTGMSDALVDLQARNGIDLDSDDAKSADMFRGHAGFPSLPDDGLTYLERLQRSNEALLQKLAALQDKIQMTNDGMSSSMVKKYADALKRLDSVTAQQTLNRGMNEEIETLVRQWHAMRLLSRIGKYHNG